MKAGTPDDATRVQIDLIARVLWHDPPTPAVVNGGERRRSRRYHVHNTPVNLWIACDDTNRRQITCTIADLSATGLGIRLAVALNVGTVIVVETGSGFAVGTVNRCEPADHATFVCGVSLEDCCASRNTVKDLIRGAAE